MPKDLLAGLSKDKLPVVQKVKGPCFVKAGAGTGKTKTIVAKIAYLIQKEGLSEDRVLALTFSNNAASHLKEEVDKLLGYASDVEVGTFHGYCKSILEKDGSKVGVGDGFELITEVDAAIILHKLGLSTYNSKRYANTIMKSKDLNIKISDFEQHLNNLKERVKALDKNEKKWQDHYDSKIIELRTLHKEDLKPKEKSALKKELVAFTDAYEEYMKYESFIQHWKDYELKKSERNALDFGDLNQKVLELMKQVSDDFLSKQYDYVIVDEFQDTNYVQFELIKHLVSDDQNITVVGDPNQTIYAFRGAYTDNVSEFIEHFKLKANDVFSLDTSFRSTQHILDASYELINQNYTDTSESPIKLTSHKGKTGDKVMIYSCLNELEEARKVKEIIDEQVASGVALNDIAVLYRSHSQGRTVKQLLEKRGYPLKIVGGTDLLSQAEIKAVISLLELVDNLENPNYMGDQSWWRVLHYENQLSPEDSILLANYLKSKRKTMQEIIFNDLSKVELSVDGLRIIKQLIKTLSELRTSKNESLTKIVMKAYELIGLNKFYDDKELRHKRLVLMRDFYQLTSEFQRLHGRELKNFINYLELYNELGQEHKSESSEENAINLMTIHASKGLEFDTVIMVNLAKSHFPLYQGGSPPLIPDELDPQLIDFFKKELSEEESVKALKELKQELKLREERKLCYVAMTRAKKKLFMTRAKAYGGRELNQSEFINNIGLDELGDYDHVTYTSDEETIADLGLDTDLDREKKLIINQLLKGLDESDVLTCINHLLTYKGLSGDEFSKKELSNNWIKLDPSDRLKRIKDKIKTGVINSLPFNATNFKLSASSLKEYNKCPKRFELSKIYGMPSYWDEDTSGALNRGSFVHKVCELAVQQKIKSEDELFKIKDSLIKQPKWFGVKTDGVDLALRTFWERSKGTISDNLFTEVYFDFMYKDFRFNGVIDRVDKIKDKQVEVIDYKTGKSSVSPEEAFIQLGLYALALVNSKKFKDLEPVKLTLDMLEQESPKSYEIKDEVLQLTSGRGTKISMKEVEELILNLAQSIMHDYTHGFEKNKKKCDDCPYKFYCE
ncbi:MAG: ATP-dependent DNA helicase [Candidatus Nanoarchaeia archaeon]|jgi:DNA helicase-2/ATP-dependent DNA helicase PcrA